MAEMPASLSDGPMYGLRRPASVLSFVIVLLWAAVVLRPATACACAIDPATTNAHQPTIAEAKEAFRQAGANQLPGDYEPIPDIETGPTEPPQMQRASIPCAVLYAVGWIESSWHQADHVPRGGSGPVLQSFDCGYGVMQITSGMREWDVGIPAAKQLRIANEYGYNIAWGAKMLVEKWNVLPWRCDASVCGYRITWSAISPRDPTVIEDWYTTLWAYNGYAFSNNPNNCTTNPDGPGDNYCFRTPYTDPSWPSRPRWWYTYPELVFGLIVNPPYEDGVRLWDPVPLPWPRNEYFGYCPYDEGTIICPRYILRSDAFSGAAHTAPCTSALPPLPFRFFLPFVPKNQ